MFCIVYEKQRIFWRGGIFFAAFLAIIALVVLAPQGVFAAPARVDKDEDLQLSATAAVVIEAGSGRVIYAKNAYERRYPASMTKMMTAILTLENVRESSPVTVSENAAATEDSFLKLKPFEQLTAHDLTLGMMLVSDNGAAVALAEYMQRDTSGFAQLMNDKAKEIGCANTHFVNPNGLPDENHYSTAADMAKIAAYCMRNKEFADTVATSRAIVRYIFPRDKFTVVENTNELLETYDGANGIKTGWTNAAGGCLAASAKRHGMTLIAVVMGASDTQTRFDDAKKLLDYGFSHAKMKRAVVADRASRTVFVRNGRNYKAVAGPVDDVDYPLIDGESGDKYSFEYQMPLIMDAPAIKGDKVGKLILKYDGQKIGETDVALRETVPQGFSFMSFFFVNLLAYFTGKQ